MVHLARFGCYTAAVVALLTAGVYAAAFAGVERMPVIECLMLPGGMIAWVWHGDNYLSGTEFLAYSAAIGIPLNAVIGFLLGVVVALFLAVVRRSLKHRLQLTGNARNGK